LPYYFFVAKKSFLCLFFNTIDRHHIKADSFASYVTEKEIYSRAVLILLEKFILLNLIYPKRDVISREKNNQKHKKRKKEKYRKQIEEETEMKNWNRKEQEGAKN
jgi:hypothetical protein